MNREFGQWIPPERCPLPSWPPGSSNTTLETFPRAKTLPRPSPHSLTTLDPRNPATRALDFRQISLNQDQRNVEFGPDTRRRRKSPFHADGPKTWTGQGRQSNRNNTTVRGQCRKTPTQHYQVQQQDRFLSRWALFHIYKNHQVKWKGAPGHHHGLAGPSEPWKHARE